MKFITTAALLLTSALLPLTSQMQAATSLTGIQILGTDASGNYDLAAYQAYNTYNTSGRFKVYVIKGDKLDDPFINGPEYQDAAINIPLSGGTYTYSLYVDCGNTTLLPYYGLSLFFNLNNTPAINVFAPLNTSSTQYFPDWFVSKGKVMRLNDSTIVDSTGKLEFVDGLTKVTITSYQFSGPTVFRKDRVDRYHTIKSGGLDFIGQFTMQVTAPPEIANGGIVNAASFTPKIAPGSLFSIFGTDLATSEASAGSVPLPLSLNGTSVTIGGKPAPLLYVSPGQLNAQVPFDLQEGTPAPVIVTVNGTASVQRSAQVVKAAPGIIQYGDKRAVVQNEDGTLNTADNGAKTGTYVVVYATGGGQVDNSVATGAAAGSDPLSKHRAPITATVGGMASEVTFGGLTPGFVGLTQVNLRIPSLAPGTYAVVLTQDGVQSNAPMITIK